MLIEFNELCPSLLRRFMSQGQLPNFRRFHDTSTVWTTDAQEEPPNLEPWIQWPSVHSGQPFAEHGIFHLGDGRKLASKSLAEALSDAGLPVGVCASMNQNYRQLNGYVMPDPWDKEGVAHPVDLQPFYAFVSRQVQESSREEPLTLAQIKRFGWFMLQNGLRVRTVQAIVKQLLHERFVPGIRWRRACLLDRMLYDVFRSLNRQHNVRFATFFCNSTAHFQHYYWRNMEPDRFDVPVPAGDHPSLQDAIAYGYRAMDDLLGQIMEDYPTTMLVLCSALSQQPWSETTKCTFRPKQFETLLAFAGVSAGDVRIKPVMAEEFHLECVSPEAAAEVEARFRALTVAGAPLMKLERTGSNVFTGCRLTDAATLEGTISRSDGATRPFGDLFYMIHGMRSGRHHADGVLWVRNGHQRVVSARVPLTALAPSILRFFGVTPPETMQTEPLPLRGTGRKTLTRLPKVLAARSVG